MDEATLTGLGAALLILLLAATAYLRRYGLRVAVGLLVLAAAVWSPWVAATVGLHPAFGQPSDGGTR